ncbi:MAG: hypothetical protein Q4F65_12585 [Propionibacteriaceae bacterium]|nr:hypothetical protein [Propionibacteriaceae bacterium]
MREHDDEKGRDDGRRLQPSTAPMRQGVGHAWLSDEQVRRLEVLADAIEGAARDGLAAAHAAARAAGSAERALADLKARTAAIYSGKAARHE